MAKIDNMVHDFLAQKRIAVVGVSDKRETGCNMAYTRFKENGYQVYPVNPRISNYDGVTCYPDLKSIPDKPDAVFILASPKVTDQIVQQCVDLGIKHVWMHRSIGIGSVSEEAAVWGRAHGVRVIPGGCPLMFEPTSDPGHKLMRSLFTLTGKVPRRV